MSPYSPTFSSLFSFCPAAVVRKRWLPWITGLERASPATGVFHSTFLFAATSQLVGPGVDETPEALCPRKEGQFSAAETVQQNTMAKTALSLCTVTSLKWQSSDRRDGTRSAASPHPLP